MSDTLNVFDRFGEQKTIPASSWPQAQAAGFTTATPDQVADFTKVQEHAGVGSDLTAALAGAARAASFGLSDQALVRTGAVNAGTLNDFKQYNPKSTLAGEAAGVVGSLAAPVATPVGLLSEAGQGLTHALAPVAENAGVISNILGQAGAHAAGSAVEGAVYGLGQSVSEHALGDPDAMGEHLLSNVGYSALLGGALGGALGLPKGLAGTKPIGEVIGGVQSDLAHAGIKPPPNPHSLTDSLDAMAVDPAKKAGILDGLKQLKPNASEIQQAADTIGAPVLESQVSASKHVQDLDSMLLQSPTPIGVGRQQVLQRGLDAMGRTLDDVLGPEAAMSEAEAGNQIKASLSSKFQGEGDPIGKLYDEIRQSTKDIDVKAQQTTRIAGEIRKLAGIRPSTPEYKLASAIADELEHIKTVNDVKEFKTSLNRQIQGDPALKYVGGQIAGKLTELEENTIINYAKKEYNVPPDQREQVLSLIDQRKSANVKYKALMEKMGEIGSVTGKKRIYGPQDFLNFIEDGITPERLLKRLSAKDNSEFTQFFAHEFPNEMRLIGELEKTKIRNAATFDGQVVPAKVLKLTDKYSPEFKKVLFTPEELKKLEATQTYHESLPRNINPSGTSKSEAYRRFYEKPISAVLDTVRDAVALKGIKGVIDTSGQGAQVQGLMGLESSLKKTTAQIQSGAKAIFAGAGKNATTAAGFVGSRLAPQEHSKLSDLVTELANNPEQLAEHLDQATGGLYHIAPHTSQALQIATVRATNLLAAKLPGAGLLRKPLSAPYVPSEAEVAKFGRYLHTLHNPVSALHQVRHGTLTPEVLETLTTVYPKMYQQMQLEVMDQLTKHMKTKMPYHLKMGVGLFLNQDLDDSLMPASIQANQLAQGQMRQDKHDAPAPAPAGLGKLGQATALLTHQQATSQRR